MGSGVSRMVTEWEWVVPFKGRNHSGPVNQNFLCKSGNVFVMDNHRAALWCWLQEVDLGAPHSLIHIDRHYDALQSRLDEWMKHLPIWSSGIDEYLGKAYQSEAGQCPVVRWDNYLSIYLESFARSLKKFYCLTHGDGDKPNYKYPLHEPASELPENLSSWLSEQEAPWIVNIDLDYFYCQFGSGHRRMLSDDYIDAVAEGLKDAMDRGAIGVLTLCLTPDSFTPGWADTEALAARLLKGLDLTFQLQDNLENI